MFLNDAVVFSVAVLLVLGPAVDKTLTASLRRSATLVKFTMYKN